MAAKEKLMEKKAELAAKAPLSGAVVLGADTGVELATRLRNLKADAEASRELGREAPLATDLAAPERIAIEGKLILRGSTGGAPGDGS